MKPISNWETIQASTDHTRLPAGGYVVRITKVEDDPTKQYITIVWDIAEGLEKGRYSDEWGKANEYAHRFIRSYKETALGMFKAFITAVEESNEGFIWTKAKWNEQALVGKLVGIVLGEEEYDNDRGETKTRLYLKTALSADKIRRGEYVVPDLRKAPERASEGLTPAPEVAFTNPINEDDLPF